MRILHSADWHLTDRLKQIDRTADLERAVERVAACCAEQAVDVLVIAGDVFSELVTPESLQNSIAHLGRTFRALLLRGGTIVAVAGNHDNDIYCETLRRAIQLGAPIAARAGDRLPNGRLYLATKPVHFQLADSDGQVVQFACMPYPTTGRYLRGDATSSYKSFAARNRLLQSSYADHLEQLHAKLSSSLPRVLVTHVNALPPAGPGAFPTVGDDDMRVAGAIRPSDWSYVALGHLHRPQTVLGCDHVRYSGSIERLSIDEKDQEKGLVVIDVHPPDRRPSIRFIRHPTTPFYDVCVKDPRKDVPRLADRYPDAADALVRCHVRYRAGEDNLVEILADIARVFPRCYERTWSAIRKPNKESANTRRGLAARNPAAVQPQAAMVEDPREFHIEGLAQSGEGPDQLIMSYLRNQLAGDPDLDSLLRMAKRLLEEVE